MDNVSENTPFHYPISGELDLHTFNPSDVPSLVEEYIQACHQKKLKTIRVIHGKGKSVLKHSVHKLLKDHPLVTEFQDARPESGGWGATLVRLKY